MREQSRENQFGDRTAGLALDHVGIVVPDLDSALERFHAVLGGVVVRFDDDEPLDCRWGRVEVAGSPPIEFVAPRGARSPYRAFLDRRGEGLHHVSFRIGDLDRERERVEALGLEVIGFDRDHAGWQELFIHPRHTSGALVHLAVPPGDR